VLSRKYLLLPLICTFALVAIGYVGHGVTQEPPAKEPFFFIQMADPQFGKFADGRNFKKETELFGKAIKYANRLKPAFVVICGDLTDDPRDKEQIAEFHRIAGKLDDEIPLYIVSGNHDVEDVPSSKTLKAYRENFGQDWYSFAVGGSKFITINTTIIHTPDIVGEEVISQMRWLRQELDVARRLGYQHTFIFGHHPFFLESPDEGSDQYTIPEHIRPMYLTLFKEYGVTAVFAGHYHQNSLGRDENLEMITTGPVGEPHGDAESGFRIVKVYDDRITHEFYAFDDMPKTVELDTIKSD